MKYKVDVNEVLGDVPVVHCHTSEISQVLINIFVNAAQACEERGALRIASSVAELKGKQYVLIEISDNGHGIADEAIQKIFDPFFTTKPVGKGTGLGLSISHGIIEKHLGKIKVASKKGIGTTFFVYLPL